MENSNIVSSVKSALESQINEIVNNDYGLNSAEEVLEFMLNEDVVDQLTRELDQNSDEYIDLMLDLREIQSAFADEAFNKILNTSKVTSYFVNIKSQDRGDSRGYTSHDYAKDVATEINKKIGDQGISLQRDQVEDLLESYSKSIGFNLLFIDSQEINIDG